MICIPAEIKDVLKKNIPQKTINDIALMDVEGQRNAIDSIVKAFDTDENYKTMIRNGIEERIVSSQKAQLERMLPQDTQRLRRFEREKAKLDSLLKEGADQKAIQKQQKVVDARERSLGQSGRKNPSLTDKLSKASRLGDFDDSLYQEVVRSKMGLDISDDQIKRINTLSQSVEARKKDMAQNPDDVNSRIAFGEAVIDLEDYTNGLKGNTWDFSMAENKLQSAQIFMNASKQEFLDLLNAPKALMTTLDVSQVARQGLPMASRKEYWDNMSTIVKSLQSEDNIKSMNAEIMTRDTYDLMKKSGLQLSSLPGARPEDAFMATKGTTFTAQMLKNVPGVKHSDRAYGAFLTKLRADVFDDLLNLAKIGGEDITDINVVRKIADSVNTGTGSSSKVFGDDQSKLLNAIFFSPRKIQATLNMFSNPQTYFNSSPTARSASVRNLVSLLGTSTLFLGLGAMMGGEVETDTKSSDFGKVKFGNVRIDVTGGNAGYITLLSRLAQGSTKSSITGIEYDLDGSFGDNTKTGTAVNWVRNKFSPTLSFIWSALDGEDAIGNEFDAPATVVGSLIPLNIQSTISTIMSDGATMGAVVGIANTLGFAAGSYGPSENWLQSETNEMTQFRERFGEDTVHEANKKYNRLIDSRINEKIRSDEYELMDNEEKKVAIRKLKDEAKKEVFREYRFLPRR